jgi:hypothetical protein
MNGAFQIEPGRCYEVEPGIGRVAVRTIAPMMNTSGFWHCEELQTGCQRVIHSLEFKRPLPGPYEPAPSDTPRLA